MLPRLRMAWEIFINSIACLWGFTRHSISPPKSRSSPPLAQQRYSSPEVYGRFPQLRARAWQQRIHGHNMVEYPGASAGSFKPANFKASPSPWRLFAPLASLSPPPTSTSGNPGKQLGSPALCLTRSGPTPYSASVTLIVPRWSSAFWWPYPLFCCPRYNSSSWAHVRRPSLILATYYFLSALFLDARFSPSCFQEPDVHAGSSWQLRQVLCSCRIV